MSERNSVFVFKGPTIEEFREAAQQAAEELGGRIAWDVNPAPMEANLLTSHNDRVHAAYVNYWPEDYLFSLAIGKRLAIPWINIRIQEGSLWDFSLYEGENNLDNFSTWPEYWNDDADWIATQRGRPEALARAWNIDRASIENYMRSWRPEDDGGGSVRFALRGKAYPADRHEYGDIWQMADFLRALGAHDPNWNEPHSIPRHLELPPSQPAGRGRRRRKAWWKFW